MLTSTEDLTITDPRLYRTRASFLLPNSCECAFEISVVHLIFFALFHTKATALESQQETKFTKYNYPRKKKKNSLPWAYHAFLMDLKRLFKCLILNYNKHIYISTYLNIITIRTPFFTSILFVTVYSERNEFRANVSLLAVLSAVHSLVLDFGCPLAGILHLPEVG